MKPLITVIVPAYNIEEYLEKCINSILEQTYKNIEIIIVDDGSKDATLKVGMHLADKYSGKVQCIHQENSGVTSARLAGIRLASGAWIGFVDGDDAIERDMYERLMQNAIKYSADISHCGYQTIINNGERVHYFYNTGEVRIQNHTEGLQDLLKGRKIEPSLCNKLYRREIIDKMVEENQMDLTIKYNEDLMMNYLLFNYSDVSVYEDICPYHYMCRTNSASHSVSNIKKIMDPVNAMKWIMDRAPEELQGIVWGRYLRACRNAYESLWDNKEYKTEAQELKQSLKTNTNKWKYMGKRERQKTRLMLYVPHIYISILKLYRRNFQRKAYE